MVFMVGLFGDDRFAKDGELGDAGVMPFGEPRMINRARVPVVGLHSR